MKALHLLAAALLLAAGAASADEGMWTLDNLPRAQLQAHYGFTPTKPWVDHVMHSAVRLAGGCSGSFISANGLVLTNHHCANLCIQQLSSHHHDYVREGFLAGKREDEAKCPQIEVNRLEAISDVTARLNNATEGKTGPAFSLAQKAEKSRIEAECVGGASETARCDVVDLYHGGEYALYRYHRFQDVRLVFAPEKNAAFFGGDPDNFRFPRFCLDMSLLRAYENGAPAQTPDHFGFSRTGAQPHELTFVLGHPGSTERQLAVAQLRRVRDIDFPSRMIRLAELRGLLTRYSAESEESARVAQEDLFAIENAYKAIYGEMEALLDPRIFALKRSEEDRLRAFAHAHPALQARYGDAWQQIEQAQGVYADLQQRWRQVELGRAFWSTYFDFARTLVRGSAERAKPNAERLREYTESALPSLEQGLFSEAPIYPEYEKLKLAWSLTQMRQWLGADDPVVRKVLGQRSPQQLADEMVEKTSLGELKLRRRLWEGGADALAKSDDPFVALARAVDPEARDLRKRFEESVEAVETKNAERIAHIRFAKDGRRSYPDATFTLRLSFGQVTGWQENGVPVPPYTTFAGAFSRATGAEPFALPASWTDARGHIDPEQRLDFVTDNDIIGGNSGSPVINRNGEVVGLIFDGNLQSLGGAFWFDPQANRAVAVHSGAILEALQKIYHADPLVREISAP